jgi:hypothetical protein
MSFDVTPLTVEERKKKQLAHSQNMLNIINSLGSYSENPLPQYNYGNQTQQLNTDVSKDFLATLLMASGGGATNEGGRVPALQRRLKKK